MIYKPCGVIKPIACPINNRTKINTDKPIRQVNDFRSLSESPLLLTRWYSAEPNAIKTIASKIKTIILKITQKTSYCI